MATPQNSAILSGLIKFTDQLQFPLLEQSVYGSDTLKWITVQEDVKNIDAINISTSNLVLQPGGMNVLSPTGSFTPTQRNLQVCLFASIETYDVNEIEQYYFGKTPGAKAGAYQESLMPAFATAFNADKVNKLNNANEQIFWNGSNATYNVSFTGGLSCTGLRTILASASLAPGVVFGATAYSTYGATTSAPGVTAGNAVAIMDALNAAIPNDILDKDIIAFMDPRVYKTISTAVRDNKYPQYDTPDNFWGKERDEAGNFVSFYLNTGILMVAVAGLLGSGEIWMSYKENFVAGCDLKRDVLHYRIWFEDYINGVAFRAQGRMGANVAYPQYVVGYVPRMFGIG